MACGKINDLPESGACKSSDLTSVLSIVSHHGPSRTGCGRARESAERVMTKLKQPLKLPVQ